MTYSQFWCSISSISLHEILRIRTYFQMLNFLVIFKGLSIEKPKPHQSISGIQTDHSSSGPPKYHSSLSSHPIEPYHIDQISLDLKKKLRLSIDYNSPGFKPLYNSLNRDILHSFCFHSVLRPCILDGEGTNKEERILRFSCSTPR